MSRLLKQVALVRSHTLISVTLLLAFTLLAPLAVSSATLTSVFVNGVRVEAYPVIRDGVAYLPIQVMAQALQSEITWDAKLGIVKVNGTSSSASVLNQDGKIYLPIEAFVTGLGGNVVYDGRNNMIKVNAPGQGSSGTTSTAVAKASTGTISTPATGNTSTGTGNVVVPAMIAAGTAAGIAAGRPNNSGSTTITTPAYGTVAKANPSYGNNASPAYGTTAKVAPRYGSNASPAYGAGNSYGQPSTANTGYGQSGTYGTPNTVTYSNPATATSGQTAYGNTAYGANTNMRSMSNTLNGVAGQSSSTVKPSYIPPYANNTMQASMAGSTPGSFPSSGAATYGTAPNVGINPIPSMSQAGNSPYIPRTAQNEVFKVTVSNLETVPVIKDFYKPRTGSKFVVASLSQQNISNQVQIYTGRFSLVDQNQNSYDHLEGLSNFWLVILRPFGVNFGYLVFEIPQNAKPISLVLHALNQPPLAINL